jgi:WD40 repeat protein
VIFLTLAALLAQVGVAGAASSPDIVLQSGHGANISALAFSPDGHYLVSASEDSTLKLWDPESGTEIRTLRGHTNIVTALAVSADSAFIASASLDHTLRVWKAATGETVTVFRGTQPTAYLLKFTPDGSSLITAETVATGSILRIWDIKTGKQVRAIKRTDAAISHVFFRGAHIMLVAEESGEDDETGALISYDLRTGRMLQTRQEVLCGVSADGRWMAIDRSTRKTRQAMIVDLVRDKPFAQLTGQVSEVMFSETGEWLAYETAAGDVAIVRKTAGGAAHSIHGRGAEFSMLALSPDGRWLATSGADFSIHLWDVATGKLAHAMAGQYTPTAVAFSPDGKRVAVNGGSTDLASAVQVWDIERRSLVSGPRVKHAVSGLAFSQDGDYLAVSGAGVEVFATRSDDLAARMDCKSGSAFSPVFSANDRWVAANCGGVITVWSVAGGGEIFHFGEASEANNGPLAFSPGGRYLAAAVATGLVVYDTVARKLSARVNTTDLVTALTFNANGEMLVFGTRTHAPTKAGEKEAATLYLLDLRTRKKVWASSISEWVSAVQFARDGQKLLVVAGDDLRRSGGLLEYETANGRLVRRLPVRVPSGANPGFSRSGEWLGYGWNSSTSLWRLRYE